VTVSSFSPAASPGFASTVATRIAEGANTILPASMTPVRSSPSAFCHFLIAAVVSAVKASSGTPGKYPRDFRFSSSCATSGPLLIPAANSRHAGSAPMNSTTG